MSLSENFAFFPRLSELISESMSLLELHLTVNCFSYSFSSSNTFWQFVCHVVLVCIYLLADSVAVWRSFVPEDRLLDTDSAHLLLWLKLSSACCIITCCLLVCVRGQNIWHEKCLFQTWTVFFSVYISENVLSSAVKMFAFSSWSHVLLFALS